MSTGRLAEYRFSVTDAPAAIVCEPLTDDPQAENCGAFAVRLKPGTSVEEAHEIASYLQAHVQGFCHIESDP